MPMFHAKGFEFSLEDLLVKKAYSTVFHQNQFFCMYLSPNDYHRVHIPLSGRLLETVYVPGDYYSVNPEVLAKIPGVFAKNERLICLFETEFGPMIYVMVGAMCVSSIYTIWAGRINEQRKGEIIETDYKQEKIYLNKGEELGHFQMGSTVIVFLPDAPIVFDKDLAPGQHCLLGEKIANIAMNTDVPALFPHR
jgi:phosphatidylserine decarboxylase